MSMTIYNPDNFPIDAFPPQVYEPVIEAHEVTKAPIPLIVNAVLAAMSFAVQHNARLTRLNGLSSPLHLSTIGIAESGERKTTVDNLFFRHLKPWLTSLQAAHAERVIRYEAALEQWKAEQKGQLLAITKLAQDGIVNPELAARFEAHRNNKPQAPHAPNFMYRDVTIEALLTGLQTWRSAGVMSNEAGMLFNGRTFNSLETFNSIWDGSPASLHRKNADPVQVSDASLTVSLMVQPQVIKDFLSNKGVSARGNGFLARCLICFPTSTQGSRFEYSQLAKLTPNLDAFGERMIELLSQTVDADGHLTQETKNLEFSFQSLLKCQEFGNWVEGQLGLNGYYADVKDAASKIGENMARIAAILHCFTGQSGLIELDTVNRATAIANWYLNQFKFLFGNNMVMSQEEMDLQILADWLRNRAFQFGLYEIPKSIIMRYGPNHLRSKPALDPVLMNLEARQLIINGKRNKTAVIQMTQALFPPQQVQ